MGMDAADTTGIWARIYKYQLGSHGMGAACAMAMSGTDMALWDIKGKAVSWPLYRLLGGSARPVPAYAGGVALGYQPLAQLIDEVHACRGRLQGGEAARRRYGARRHRADGDGAQRLRRRAGDPNGCQYRLWHRRFAVGDAGDGHTEHRLAGGAFPGA